MINTIVTLIITLMLFIIFDLVWFSVSLSTIYLPKFTEIQGLTHSYFSKIAGGIFAWFLLALGINLFVLPKSNNTFEAVLNGALFGFIIYGVYNGTNYVTFQKYDMNILFPDLLWGTLVSAAVSGIIYNLRILKLSNH
ncbi:putative membrane protein [Indivirus ILV1]|uniref:Putative membrane protein n=1 Tax=Indivirus ILV1 TaxID=1977633 RepID=A0A1V0SD05_9VIRU|nr:putative membrane protein [Indivirus ILV1]